MASIPSQLDNLKIAGLQTASISLFSNVARQLQITNGSHAAGWANTLNSMHQIVLADNLRVQNIDKIQSSQYLANSFVSRQDVEHVDQSQIDQSTINIPGNINSANGIITASAVVLLHEKTFANAMTDVYVSNISANINALSNFITTTLNQNNVYAQANVLSTLDYALKYGHLNDWTNLTSKDFNLNTHTDQVQRIFEAGHTLVQTSYSSYLP
jgi:hypothetical protein